MREAYISSYKLSLLKHYKMAPDFFSRLTAINQVNAMFKKYSSQLCAKK